MVVESMTVEAIDSLVALLRVAENSAVHCWEQEEPFDPGIFSGLILLARFAAERAGTEYRLALEVAEQLAQVTAERDAALKQSAELTEKYGESSEVERRWEMGDVIIKGDQRAMVSRATNLVETLTGEKSGPSGDQWTLENMEGWSLADLKSLRDMGACPVCYGASSKCTRCGGLQLSKNAGKLPADTIAELTKKAGELPAEPAPESYQWQLGDEVINRGDLRAVDVASEGWIKLHGLFSCCSQTVWEHTGWKLHRKASESTGTDGEVQS